MNEELTDAITRAFITSAGEHTAIKVEVRLINRFRSRLHTGSYGSCKTASDSVE